MPASAFSFGGRGEDLAGNQRNTGLQTSVNIGDFGEHSMLQNCAFSGFEILNLESCGVSSRRCLNCLSHFDDVLS